MEYRWGWMAVIIFIVGTAIVLSILSYTVNESNSIAYSKIAEMIEHGSNPEEVRCAIWDDCPPSESMKILLNHSTAPTP